MSATTGMALALVMAFIASVASSSGQDTRTMSAPASSMPRNLLDGGAGVTGDGVGHGLDRDRRVAADRHLADHDLARFAPVNVAISANAHYLRP